MANQATILKTYPDRYIRCKFFRFHAMFLTREIAEDYDGRPAGCKGFVAECSSCGTKRTMWIWPSTGIVERSWYDWPDDYRLDLDEPLDTSLVKREVIRRVTVKRKAK